MRRGTTPTIKLHTSIDLSGFSRVVVTIRGTGAVDVEKDRITFDPEDGKRLRFTLTQKETLAIGLIAELQIRAVTRDGLALASEIAKLEFKRVLKDGVIDG